MIYIAVFVFGALVGSFLNVVILRYKTGFSPLRGKSCCFSCGKKLKWHELIPIFSFLIQKGRCKGCGSRISWQYPIIEILTGLLFLLIFICGRFNLPQILIVSLLIIIAVYDFRHKIIPNLFVWVFNGLVFGILIFSAQGGPASGWEFENSAMVWDLLAGFAFSGFFALLWLISKGKWMGFGDAKLALGLGWLLGLEKTIMAFIFSFWLGAIVGVGLILLNKSKFSMKSQIPFGPFLVLGSFMALLVDYDILSLFL